MISTQMNESNVKSQTQTETTSSKQPFFFVCVCIEYENFAQI